MADLLPETDNRDFLELRASSLRGLVQDHKGQDVSILDLRGTCNWTDFFIIATASSKTHIDGLERHIKDYCHENGIDILGCSRKNTEDEWRLIDLGQIIIHLMNQQSREFYDLERLWRNP